MVGFARRAKDLSSSLYHLRFLAALLSPVLSSAAAPGSGVPDAFLQTFLAFGDALGFVLLSEDFFALALALAFGDALGTVGFSVGVACFGEALACFVAPGLVGLAGDVFSGVSMSWLSGFVGALPFGEGVQEAPRPRPRPRPRPLPGPFVFLGP